MCICWLFVLIYDLGCITTSSHGYIYQQAFGTIPGPGTSGQAPGRK